MWPMAWPWALALLATNVPAPGVGDAGHNIIVLLIVNSYSVVNLIKLLNILVQTLSLS